LETLGMLIEQAPTAPLMLVATYRPELAPPWPQRSHMTPITLNHLGRPEVTLARSKETSSDNARLVPCTTFPSMQRRSP
jgi:hypothetical protein